MTPIDCSGRESRATPPELLTPALAIRLAIYCAVDGQMKPHTPNDSTDVTCDNMTTPHQTNVCRATTDQKVGGSSPSERATLEQPVLHLDPG